MNVACKVVEKLRLSVGPLVRKHREVCMRRAIPWQSRKLSVLEIKCLKSMTGVTRFVRIRKDDVRVRMGVVSELADRVRTRVMRWLGHMECVDEGRSGEEGDTLKSEWNET